MVSPPGPGIQLVELCGRSAGGEQLLQQTDACQAELPAQHVSRPVPLELRRMIAVSPRGSAAADRPQVGARTHLVTVRTRSRLISVTERELAAARWGEGAAVVVTGVWLDAPKIAVSSGRKADGDIPPGSPSTSDGFMQFSATG